MKTTDEVPADTSPAIDRLYRSLLMRRSGAERLRMAAAMFDATRAMVAAHVRRDASTMSEADTRVAVFARIYATDLDERTRAKVVERVRRSRPTQDGDNPNNRDPDVRAQHKRWLENWKRVGPILEAERWERLRNMSDEEARRTVRDVHDLWQDDWVGDAGEELLLHQQTFARARRRAG